MTSADFLRQVLLHGFCIFFSLFPMSVRPPQIRAKLSILCLLHLHHPFRIAIGLQFVLKPYPQVHALYEDSVRQTRYLPPASFRFHLTIDTLALGYAIPAIRARSDLHPLANAHAERTKNGSETDTGIRAIIFNL